MLTVCSNGLDFNLVICTVVSIVVSIQLTSSYILSDLAVALFSSGVSKHAIATTSATALTTVTAITSVTLPYMYSTLSGSISLIPLLL